MRGENTPKKYMSRGKRQRRQRVILTIVIIAIVTTFAASYLLLQPSPDEEAPPTPQPAAATLEDNIKAVLADNKGVAKEKVGIQFYQPTENQGILAVGAIIENSGSNLLFYDSNSQTIIRMQLDSEAENSEIAIVWGVCAQKDSEWAGNKLVPWGFNKIENVNAYHFLYCDGYTSEWSKWSIGTATIYMNNQEIEWGFFF